MTRLAAILVMLVIAGCNSSIYLRDGVTDGDTFYLANSALSSSDPALQSWVTYSLGRSACQLQIGGDNPARASSYDCELTSRRMLLETWSEQRLDDPLAKDDYLDTLAAVDDAGLLDEYVAHYLGRSHWTLPDDLDMQRFADWRQRALRNHKPKTRIVGSWNFAQNVVPR